MNRLLVAAVSVVLVNVSVAPAGSSLFLGKSADAWRKELNNPEASVRRSAAFALGRMGDEARGAVSQLVRRLQETLSRQLYAPNRLERSQVFADFALRLSLSPVLEKLKTLPIYGPAPREDTHIVATVSLEVSAAEAGAKWKRLSRPRKESMQKGQN